MGEKGKNLRSKTRIAIVRILSILLVFISFNGLAQSALQLKANKDVRFFLLVNGNLVDSIAKSEWKLTSTKQDYDLSLYSDSLDINSEHSISVSPNKRASYDVLRLGSDYQLLQATGTDIKDFTGISVDDLSTQYHAFKDSLQLRYLQKKYGKQAKCIPPISRGDFENILEEAKEKTFNALRLKYLNKELSKHCFYVEQLNELYDLFDFDEQKLSLSKMFKGIIVDLGEVEQLAPNFVLESAEKEFETILKDLKED